MPSFSLVIEYLTGYSVATDPANREQAEWPPHPARVFMALAAAHFETDPTNQAQRDALEWLATLGPPDVTAPGNVAARNVLTVYVPVNDQAAGDALLKRSRQPRYFPRVHVGSQLLRQTWHLDGELPDSHLNALEVVCRGVSRIGHSSSLVWVRLERNAHVEPNLVPDEYSLAGHMRIPQAGALQQLEDSYNQQAIEQYAALEVQINSSSGKARKQLQEQLTRQFPAGKPQSLRPTFSINHGYRTVQPTSQTVHLSKFDQNFIVLRPTDNSSQVFGLESTAQILAALRNVIMGHSGKQPVPPWVGGHEPNGGKLQNEPHMALVPLAYVGRPWVRNEFHADGHLMGVAILVPHDIPMRERAEVLSPVLFENSGALRELTLVMGRDGKWPVARTTDLDLPITLQTQTYCGPATSWATVTPVLLDRMPKNDRFKEPSAWREEVAEIVCRSCRNVELPEPVSVRVEKTPFFRGSLRAMPGQGGFPQLRRDKFQVHLQIDFDRPVQGPVLLGAGRFRGYGLLRPWKHGV